MVLQCYFLWKYFHNALKLGVLAKDKHIQEKTSETKFRFHERSSGCVVLLS